MYRITLIKRIALLLAMSLGILCPLKFTLITRAQTGLVYRVDKDAPGPLHDGLTWTSAYTTLQDALTQARTVAPTNTLEIWVAEGVYYPDEGGGLANNNPEANFSLINNVSVYGGFGGFGINETARSQRNWATHLTVLSGDIDKNDRTEPRGIVTATASISGSNAYHVVTANAVYTATVDGFAITAGAADVAWDNGGGISLHDSKPHLLNLIFSANRADYQGGGMYNQSGSPRLTNVTFNGNSAGDGGGMYSLFSSKPQLTNVVFSGNSATSSTGAGGLETNQSSDAVLNNVIFRNNQGGWGGGMSIVWSNPRLTNVLFVSNRATWANGLYNAGNPYLTNVTFYGNSDGMVNNGNTSPTLVNVIMGSDSFSNADERQKPTIAYSLIQNCGSSGAGWSPSCGTDGGGNITGDPQFIDPNTGNYHLRSTSPAVDAGNNLSFTTGITTDLSGRPRFVEVASHPNTGLGTPPLIDMGAYETQLAVSVDKHAVSRLFGPRPAITYTIAFTNTGDFTLTQICITDIVPSHVNVTRIIRAGVSITQVVASHYAWYVQDLPRNRTGVITLVGSLNTLLPGGPAGAFTNTAIISADSIAPVSSSVRITPPYPIFLPLIRK